MGVLTKMTLVRTFFSNLRHFFRISDYVQEAPPPPLSPCNNSPEFTIALSSVGCRKWSHVIQNSNSKMKVYLRKENTTSWNIVFTKSSRINCRYYIKIRFSLKIIATAGKCLTTWYLGDSSNNLTSAISYVFIRMSSTRICSDDI